MGPESGETLDQILRRKEIERVANGGFFAWGVGSSLGDSMELLQRVAQTPSVLFTSMRSRAKRIDSSPNSLLLWVGGLTRSGVRVELPRFTLLISRGHTELRAGKKKHYALLCHSHDDINAGNRGRFDGRSVVNLKTGNPVGSSQVTAIVKKSPVRDLNPCYYDIGFSATLIDRGQITLDEYVSVSRKDIRRALEAACAGDVDGWKSEVTDLRERDHLGRQIERAATPSRASLFSP